MLYVYFETEDGPESWKDHAGDKPWPFPVEKLDISTVTCKDYYAGLGYLEEDADTRSARRYRKWVSQVEGEGRKVEICEQWGIPYVTAAPSSRHSFWYSKVEDFDALMSRMPPGTSVDFWFVRLYGSDGEVYHPVSFSAPFT